MASAFPLYAQVEESIANDILKGVLAIDEQLPTEDELIHRFQVSRPTIRQAIKNLAARGLVEIRRGRGTFVTQPRITQELTSLTGFVEDMSQLGRKPSARVLGHKVVKADVGVARKLRIAVGTPVTRILRVRLADEIPVSFDETYLPLEIGKKIIKNNLEENPIFSLLEEKYGIALTGADYTLEATLAPREIAASLAIPTGSAVFLINRTSFTTGNKPVDYEKLYYRGDLIRFSTHLARNRKLKN